MTEAAAEDGGTERTFRLVRSQRRQQQRQQQQEQQQELER
jgi:hypothetical protein